MCKVVRADGRGVKAAPKAAHAEEEKNLYHRKHAEHRQGQTTDKLSLIFFWMVRTQKHCRAEKSTSGRGGEGRGTSEQWSLKDNKVLIPRSASNEI